VFRICVLYVDEEISVQRQLSRGRMIREHNIEVKKTGQGVFWDERVTDNDESVSIPLFLSSAKDANPFL
jgi:adenylate kinase